MISGISLFLANVAFFLCSGTYLSMETRFYDPLVRRAANRHALMAVVVEHPVVPLHRPIRPYRW